MTIDDAIARVEDLFAEATEHGYARHPRTTHQAEDIEHLAAALKHLEEVRARREARSAGRRGPWSIC
jgi:hypothetical protein